MNAFISTIVNLTILIALVYWNQKVETTGSKEEKWVHDKSIVGTAKLLIFFALVGLGFDILKILCHFLGLITEAPALAPNLTVSLIAVAVIYFFLSDYYKKPESEQKKLRKLIYFLGE
ncbi:hypothetical protein [Candidatus Enterococcus ferrettii]|uniref:Holin n=1 Tax=Candidatus Enterococcus ferrettii TaxID=2815324 RepID=A0ABV0EUZ2_9ENTE|nr:hypothetical protein [Enterococcus sp. 665A]MBO1341681.1 hypothetical protein [Enterococcus sp. 665A]